MTVSFNVENVRSVWNEKQRAERRAHRQARMLNPDASYDDYPYEYVREVWSDFIIVEREGNQKGAFVKYPFTVAQDGTVSFGSAQAVKQQFVALSAPDSELLWESTALSRLEDTVALAGTEHVGAYKRTSKSGKVVSVEAYFRSPGKMSVKEMGEALTALEPQSKSSNTAEANRAKNQIQAIKSEQRKRGAGGGAPKTEGKDALNSLLESLKGAAGTKSGPKEPSSIERRSSLSAPNKQPNVPGSQGRNDAHAKTFVGEVANAKTYAEAEKKITDLEASRASEPDKDLVDYMIAEARKELAQRDDAPKKKTPAKVALSAERAEDSAILALSRKMGS